MRAEHYNPNDIMRGNMKIALVTDDGITISQHFGRASKYAVYTLDETSILEHELRDKIGHRQFAEEEKNHQHQHQGDARGHGYGRHAEDKHQRMFANIQDCEVVIARGMGRGAYQGMLQAGLKPIVTDIAEIEVAVMAVLDGSIKDHPEVLH
jgi:predicted Fe-Mo cluster-binding NifX family protein